MIRRVPVLASLVVIGAVAVLVGLGVWQLQRARWKEGILARYAHRAGRGGRCPPRLPRHRACRALLSC